LAVGQEVWRSACTSEAVQFRNLTTQCQSAVRPQILPAASMSGLALTLLAVVAGALGVWRLGVDPGWTGPFFVAGGLFSRYQLWFAFAIAAQTSAFILNRWVARQVIGLPALAA
jgi:hypothetical protein